jgi:hypothetical protein
MVFSCRRWAPAFKTGIRFDVKLMNCGVEFVAETGGGAGVRLRKGNDL